MKAIYTDSSIEDLGFIGRGRSRHRPRDDESLYGGKYPFIQTGDVKHAGLYISEYTQTYNEKGLAQSKLWEPGTLCITIAANIADTSILTFPACFPDSIIGFIPYKSPFDAKFVKYCIDALKIQIESISHGTTQDNLSLEKLRTIKFKVPQFDFRKKIAAILSAYDDLIENNNRRIALLEKAAEELYKEWFVRMRFPGCESAKFEKGIPEGWEVKKVGDAFVIKRGRVISSDDLTEGKIPVIGGGISFSSYHNKSNTVSPTITISASGANAGFVNLYYQNIWASDCSFIDTTSTESIYYAYLTLKTRQSEITNLQKGSAQPHVYAKDVMDLGMIMPDLTIHNKFEFVVNPIFNNIKFLQSKNTNLKTTRDRLLTRLISGKLSVEDLNIKFPKGMEE